MRVTLILVILVLIGCTTMNKQQADSKIRHYPERMAYPDDAGLED